MQNDRFQLQKVANSIEKGHDQESPPKNLNKKRWIAKTSRNIFLPFSKYCEHS